jgi:hypothetical protein
MPGPLRLRRRISRLDTRIRYFVAAGSPKKWGIYGGLGLLGFGLVWIAITGYVARSDAQQIRTRLNQVQSLVAAGDVQGAEQVAAKIPALAARAHRLTTGPAWFIASEVPYLGTPLKIARGTTSASDELGSRGISVLLKVALSIDPATLRTNGHTVDLAPLATAAPKLKIVAAAVHDALHTLQHTPSSSWFASVDGVRASLTSELTAVGGYVDAASRAAQVLPSMLGEDSPKRYFIGLQNEAEMRGTGGLPGAFAILVADHGQLTFTHFESDAALTPHATGSLVDTGLDFGAQYNLAYNTSSPTKLFENSNVSPNFPYAAQIWAAMWEKVSGEHVDGAMAMDPGVLANLLHATGPVRTAQGAVLNAQNVVALTEQQEYAIFNNNTTRRAFLVGVLKSGHRRDQLRRGDSAEQPGLRRSHAQQRRCREARLLLAAQHHLPEHGVRAHPRRRGDDHPDQQCSGLRAALLRDDPTGRQPAARGEAGGQPLDRGLLGDQGR